MTPSRRDFFKHLGIAVASLAMTRCTAFKDWTEGSARDRVRGCWLRLDWLAEETRDWDSNSEGCQARADLVAIHRAALDEIVTAGELEPEVARCVRRAYSAATDHIWRINCGPSCYTSEPGPDYTYTTRSQLIQQADLLAGFARVGDLDPETVAEAQATVERDVAFLCMPSGTVQTLYDDLIEAAGDGYGWPTFDELDLDISPEAEEAARFLIALILEEDE